jgi:hypothetical protein
MTTTPNRAPATAGAIPDHPLRGDGGRTTLDVARYFWDPDGDTLTYEATSSQTSVVRVTVSGSELTLDPGNDGTATITVTARDPAGLSATQTFRVTVEQPANRAPTAVGAIPDQSLREDGDRTTLDVARYFEDPDGDTLSYRASSSWTSVVRVTVSGSEITLDPRNDGTATITVTAGDPAGLSTTQTFGVIVGPSANRAPAAVGAIPDQSLREDGSTRTLDVARYFEDPDGDRLTYEARSSRTSVVRVAVSGSAITLDPRNGGTATITVTASDPSGRSATQTFRVTVGPEPPSGNTVLYEVGDRIRFPSGFPRRVSGVSVVIAGGQTVYSASRGGYVEWSDYRFTCVAARCEVADSVVTVGTLARTPAGQEPE